MEKLSHGEQEKIKVYNTKYIWDQTGNVYLGEHFGEENGTVLVSSQTEQTEGKVKRRNKCSSAFSRLRRVLGEQERRLGARRVLMSSTKIPGTSWTEQGFPGVWLWLCHPHKPHPNPREVTVWVPPLSLPGWKCSKAGWSLEDGIWDLLRALPSMEERAGISSNKPRAHLMPWES